MVFGSNEIQIPSKIAVATISILLTAAITFNVWAVQSVYARPTYIEVKELIIDKSPYITDRSLILKMIQDTSENYKELKKAIDANTRAVIELKALLKQD